MTDHENKASDGGDGYDYGYRAGMIRGKIIGGAIGSIFTCVAVMLAMALRYWRFG